MKNNRIITSTIIILCNVLLSSCAVNPATGSAEVVLMSESSEINEGKELYEKLIKDMPLYEDDKVNQYVNDIGQKMAKHSDRPDLKYRFTVIDAPDINAFALPGGYIFVNRGLLAYLSSEAQLASVLAHEIGHVTARHSVRQDAAKTGANILSLFSILATGSAAVADVASLYSTAAVKGYGREMELEADGLAAEYLFRAGYDPQAVVGSISVLKDQEKFMRYRAKEEGKKARSYHGIFASHPRNDVRLKALVAKAGTYEDNINQVINDKQFREKTEGMIYGLSYQTKKSVTEKKENRYVHSKLGFTLVFPENWKINNGRSAIIGEATDKSAELKLEVKILKKPVQPSEFIRATFGIKLLSQSENFKQYGMVGHMGIVAGKDDEQDKRVAVLYQGRKAYLFTGSVLKPKENINYDELFLTSIHSFQPARGKRKLPKAKTIHYVKANANTKFKDLAKQVKIGRYPEEQLRLINGFYPRGEPKPGEWIKIIK